MTAWRMAMRAGSRGPSMWPDCRIAGVAAITYPGVVDAIDFSKHGQFEPRSAWAKLAPSQKASLGRLVYEFHKGDVIYVKEGKFIVGKGEVLGGYQYNHRKLRDEYKNFWRHQVRVKWDLGFPSVEILLGAERLTIRTLSAEEVSKIEQLARTATLPGRRGQRRPHGAGFGTPEANQAVEQAAIRAVRSRYGREGWTIRSVERERVGYDLQCTKGRTVREVEVKGVSGEREEFLITAQEVHHLQASSQAVLCVVTSAGSPEPSVQEYTGGAFCSQFDLAATSYRASKKG